MLFLLRVVGRSLPKNTARIAERKWKESQFND
nr:MAG TPA: hypothetical protein [Caudoviricetes sp.]